MTFSSPLRMALAFALGVGAGRLLRRSLACADRSATRWRHGGHIVHHAGDAIISTDADARIVLANPSAARLFGVPVGAMHGEALSRFIVGDGTANGHPNRRFSDYAATGKRANGEHFSLEGSVSSSLHDGREVTSIILRDVSERLQVQRKLARSHNELRQLSAALQTIREQERSHIARELHDDLGQLLASLRMDLTLLQQVEGNSEDSVRLMQLMETNLLTAIVSLRRIASNLRPRALDEGGLYFALQALRHEFSKRYNIACTLYADEDELRLDDDASTVIFRIVQESLTNIARHAGATDVKLNLYRLDGQLLITIQDNGRGIAPADMEKAESLGLVGMRERVWGMQGDIAVSADEPPGTRIDIVLPITAHLR